MKPAAHLQTDQSSHRSAAESNRPHRETKGSSIFDDRSEAVAQRQQLKRAFGSGVQRQGIEEEELQMNASLGVLQRQGPEEEGLLKGTCARFNARAVLRKTSSFTESLPTVLIQLS